MPKFFSTTVYHANLGTIISADFLRNKEDTHNENSDNGNIFSRYFPRQTHRPALALCPMMAKVGAKVFGESVFYGVFYGGISQDLVLQRCG